MFGPDVFISYSREDRDHARRFAQTLAQEGLRVWWDDAIHSGQTFDQVIEQELRAAKAVVVLWSPRSVISRWVRSEASIADRHNRLVPAIIEACDRPVMFELMQTADLSHWDGDTQDRVWQVFLKDVVRLVRPEGSEGAASPPSPMIGMPDAPPPAPPPPPPTPAPPPEPGPDEEFEPTQFISRADREDYLGPVRHCLELGEGERVDMRVIVGPLGIRIGRAPPADLVLSDPLVSRSHCKLDLAEGAMQVTDLHSTNGTFVGGKRIEGSVTIEPGATLGVGSRTFTYRIRDKSEV